MLITCDKCKFAKDGICTLRAPAVSVYSPRARLYASLQPALPTSNQCGEGEPKPEASLERACKWCKCLIRLDSGMWRSYVGSCVCTQAKLTCHEPAEVTP